MRQSSTRVVLALGLAAVTTLVDQGYVGGATIYQSALEARREAGHQHILQNRLPPGKQWVDYGGNGVNTRVFVVYLAEGIHRVFSIGVARAYFLIDTVALFFSLLLLLQLLRSWVPAELALAGLLYTGVMLPLTYFFHYFHPWDRVSLLVWVGLLSLLRAGRVAWFGVLLVLGMFVKYDVLVVPGLYFLVWFDRKSALRVIGTTALLFGLTFGTYFLMIQLYGMGVGDRPILAIVKANLLAIRDHHIWYPPLLAFLLPAVLAVRGFPHADRFARSAVIFGVLLALVLFLTSYFVEVRAEMPLLLLLLPCALIGLRGLFSQNAPVPAPQSGAGR